MRERLDAIIASRWLVPVGLPLLVLLSLSLRSRQLHAGFWIDEGISVGISHEHWTSIPHLLRQDGSPPLYYMLLGIWVRLFGDSEAATHTLSLVFGLACVPLAFFAARAVFGRLAGLAAAVLAALDPFLTYYAQETRMYELEALLSLVVAWSYVEGILRGRRVGRRSSSSRPSYSPTATTGGSSCASASPSRPFAFARERLRLFGIAGAGVAVLYAPWIPTLLSQARHTGAPWSTRPSFHDLFLSAGTVIGGDAPFVALVLVGGAALGGILVHQRTRERREIAALLTVSAVTVALAFVNVADLARVDGALLRRHLRAGRARRRSRDRTCAGARPRDARRARLSLCRLLGQERQGEREGDHRRDAAVPEDRRPDRLHPSGAGAGAALLPRARVSLGHDARPRARPADLRLARRGVAAEGAPRSSRRSTTLLQPCRRERHSSSSSRFSATIVRGARRGRSSSGARQRTGRGCWSTIRVSSSSPISGATRSRSRRTTSSRFRRLSTAESGSKGTIARTAPAAPPAMANDITQTTLVLGGGPAGLTAGYLLGKRGPRRGRARSRGPGRRARRRRSSATAIASTSAATASSRRRSRSTTCGTRSSATSSCAGRACRASTGTSDTSTTRCAGRT